MKEKLKAALCAWVDAGAIVDMYTSSYTNGMLARAMVRGAIGGNIGMAASSAVVLLLRKVQPAEVQESLRGAMDDELAEAKARARVPTAIIGGLLCRLDLSDKEKLAAISNVIKKG